jgi:peptidoglycan/LPS O-acetylase OafA/YrhL
MSWRRLPRGPRLDALAVGGRRANNFDLLRLLAALMVVLAHSFDLVNDPEPFPHLRVLTWGTLGVIIFFSISGYLVAGSWANNPRLLPFVVKRALRLMPGLIVALLVSALVLGPLVSSVPSSSYFREPGTKAYVLENTVLQTDYYLPGVFVHNAYPSAVNGSLWTLPLEVKAYVFVALAGLATLLTRRRWLMVPIAVLAVLCSLEGPSISVPGADHFIAGLANIQIPPGFVAGARAGTLTVYADMFAAFAVAAALYAMRSRVPIRWDLAALGVLALAVAGVIGGLAPVTCAAVVVPYLVLCLAYRTHDRVRLPRWFGDYSYGIYVYAFPIQQTISDLVAPTSGWVMFVLAVPVTVAVAVLSWHFVERPALDLKRRLTGGTPVPAVVS